MKLLTCLEFENSSVLSDVDLSSAEELSLACMTGDAGRVLFHLNLTRPSRSSHASLALASRLSSACLALA